MPGRRSGQALILCLGALWAIEGVCAQEEAPEPLRFTVRPSFSESVETLDEKLARRERSFRFICIGCARADGRIDMAPFSPLATLGRAIPAGREMFGLAATPPEPAASGPPLVVQMQPAIRSEADPAGR